MAENDNSQKQTSNVRKRNIASLRQQMTSDAHMEQLERLANQTDAEKQRLAQSQRPVKRTAPARTQGQSNRRKRKKRKQARQLKAVQQANASRPVKKTRTTWNHKNSLPIFIVSLLILIGSVFYISPLSKQKNIVVDGVNYTTVEDIYSATGIKDSDFFTTVILHHKEFEKNIVNGNSWVKSAAISYSFPFAFEIDVVEHSIVGYQLTADGYVAVLDNGSLSSVIDPSNLPETFLLLNLVTEKNNKVFIEQMEDLEETTLANISEVTYLNDSVTKDLVQLQMNDGNQVIVPLSELAEKMRYYPNVASKVVTGSVIDMEIGIFVQASEESEETEATEDVETVTVEVVQ